MNPKTRISMVFMTFLLALALSAMWTIPVLADDGTPPPTDAPAVTDASSEASPAQEAPPEASPAQQDTPAEAPPAQQDTPSEAPAAEAAPTDPAPSEAPVVEAAPTDPAPVEAPAVEAAPTDPAPVEAPAVEAVPSEVPAVEAVPTEPTPVDTGSVETDTTDTPALPADLSQVPTGTDVVVLDANGTVVPLASTEAAQIVATGDPIWCPSSVLTPISGGSGCSSSFSSFKEVVDWLTANPKTVAGTIWIAKEYDSSVNDLPATVNFTLDGLALGTTANYALTLKGGWNGIGTNTIDTLDPSVFSGDSLSILNWKADVTLNDILITGVTGAGSIALNVTTTNNITLTRVNVNDNDGAGARLDNSGGTGTVSVSSSGFLNNAGEAGLVAKSKGAITVTGVTANGSLYGAALMNSTGTGVVTVSLSNFSNNTGGDGLGIWSKGAITLNSVTANGNSDVGARLFNSFASTTAGITLTGTNAFNNNYTGLNASSNGAITANNVTASGNGHTGAEIDNCHVDILTGVCQTVTPQPVTLTGTNTFSDNNSFGLSVQSKGAITLNSVVVNDNGTAGGAYIVNGFTGATADITLTGINTFNGNSGPGLNASSKGAITMNNVTANLNVTNYAVILNNNGAPAPKNVTFTGTNSFTGNSQDGLTIYSKGVITLNSVTANGNGNFGAYLFNEFTGATAGISLIGTNAFNGNTNTGLFAYSHGTITANNVTASDNGNLGAGLYNDYTGVTAGITLTGTNAFNNNTATGLIAISHGAITVNSVTANGNGNPSSVGANGAVLDNWSAATPQALTLNGTNSFSNNYGEGLDAYSRGLITLNNLTANGNGLGHDDPATGTADGMGIFVDNRYSTAAPQDVIINNSTFNNNWLSGLNVESYGAITLNNATANTNGQGLYVDWGDGVYLDNCQYNSGTSLCQTVTPKPVTLTGANTFNGNKETGLHVASKGAITTNNLTANDNGSYGTYLDNQWTGAVGGININGTSEFARNIGTGIEAFSNGNIVLTNLDAYENHNNGVYLDNDVAGTSGSVSVGTTLAGWYNALENNLNNGLVIYSRGAITLLNVTADGNGAKGALLDNRAATSAMPVTLTTVGNEFNNNTENGLSIYSKGLITLKDIDVIGNGCSAPGSPTCFAGIYLDNTFGTAGITMTGTNVITENHYGGLAAFSRGAVAINNLLANYNGSGAGALIDNCGWNGTNCTNTVAVPVAFTGTNEFKFNSVGLRVYSNGAISLSNVSASNNNGLGAEDGGAYLRNNFAFASSVTLAGTNNFLDNGRTGLTVLSKGAITLNNVAANGNGKGADPLALPDPILPYGYGAFLDNHLSATPQLVTLNVSATNPDNTFNNNYSGGLVIYTKGAITLNGVDASSNTNGNGATLKNDYSGAVGGITIGGWGGNFGGNAGYGLNATSLGAITANNLWAWGNSLNGAFLDNSTGAGAVTISADTSYGNNGSTGLEVHSKGAITLNTIYAESNGGEGMFLDNTYSGTATPQAITINGANHNFNNNAGDGLLVYSYGAITITNLNARNNGDFGAYLDNCRESIAGTCTANTANAITLNGNNSFERNGDGLGIKSKGVITANNLRARDNVGIGVMLNNQMTGAVGGINVNNTTTSSSEFARNSLDGLTIYSNGNITVMDLEAYENGKAKDPFAGYGVYLDNASGGGSGNVSLGTSRANWSNRFNDNFLSGLKVKSNGTVTLSNLDANNNGGDNGIDPVNGYGVLVDNSSASLPKTVVLNGSNNFYNNSNGGLYIYSRGSITVNNIEADDNGSNPGGGDGAHLDNSTASAPQPVALQGDNYFYNNYNNGLSITSKGAITVNNISSNNNGDGAELDNTSSGPSLPQNVTLTGYNEFNNNYNNGLEILSHGAITLNNIRANENGQSSLSNGYGVSIDNYTGSTQAKTVTLNTINLNHNYTGGLEVHSLGAITVNNLSANNNTGFGAFLDNSAGSPPNGVTITNGAFSSRNGGYGLQVTTKGAITINVVDAWAGDNGGYGWNLDNHFSGAVGGITLSSVNSDWAFDFANNGGYGLWAQSLGAITIAGLDTNNNGGFGAKLDNAFPGSTGTVSLTTTTGSNDFSGNSGDGLIILSNRAITINNLYANGNSGSGVMLDNTSSGAGSPQDVVINGSGEFSNNGNTGLKVVTYGLITLNNISASSNGQNNFYAEANSLPIDPNWGWGADLDNHTGTTPKGVTLNGYNWFNNNYQDGLLIKSKGAILLSNLSSDNNRGGGAYLNNQWSGAVGGITITSSSVTSMNTFNYNGGKGLVAYSKGAITISNIQANRNIAGGAYLDTFGASTPQTVTLSGRNIFNNNGNGTLHTANGLEVRADGQITINNLAASGNDGTGAVLDNKTYSVLPATVTLSGINTFSGNYSDGLYINSRGAVTASQLTADRNGARGTYIGADGNITIACGSMTNNLSYGWEMQSPGTITLKGVFAYGNHGAGLTPNTKKNNGTLVQIRTCP